MNRIQIGNRYIGDGEPCLIIAEVGVNHNGNFELAKRLIDVSKDAGADVVKFQTFKAEGVVTASADMAAYQKSNTGKKDSQLGMLQNLEMDYSFFPLLEEYCKEKDILFMSTPHSSDAIEFLDPLVPAHKVSSSDLTNIPAIEEMASTGKPILLSTGMGTLDEIVEAVDAIQNQGNEKIVLLQCVSNYPSNIEDQNMLTIKTLRERFGLLTGYSDHTIGETAALIAVSLGACVIAKHITLDRNLPGPDHIASIEPDDFKRLVALVRTVESALGDGVKKPTPEEIQIASVARKSLVAKVDIPEGCIISKDMIDIKRPQTGMRPKELRNVIGKRARTNISKDHVIVRDMIE